MITPFSTSIPAPDGPHRLTAHPNDAPTDAKRVLERILADSRVSRSIPAEGLVHRIARCFNNLVALQQVGGPCGLNAFVGAVRAELAPRLNLPPG